MFSIGIVGLFKKPRNNWGERISQILEKVLQCREMREEIHLNRVSTPRPEEVGGLLIEFSILTKLVPMISPI